MGRGGRHTAYHGSSSSAADHPVGADGRRASDLPYAYQGGAEPALSGADGEAQDALLAGSGTIGERLGKNVEFVLTEIYYTFEDRFGIPANMGFSPMTNFEQPPVRSTVLGYLNIFLSIVVVIGIGANFRRLSYLMNGGSPVMGEILYFIFHIAQATQDQLGWSLFCSGLLSPNTVNWCAEGGVGGAVANGSRPAAAAAAGVRRPGASDGVSGAGGGGGGGSAPSGYSGSPFVRYVLGRKANNALRQESLRSYLCSSFYSPSAFLVEQSCWFIVLATAFDTVALQRIAVAVFFGCNLVWLPVASVRAMVGLAVSVVFVYAYYVPAYQLNERVLSVLFLQSPVHHLMSAYCASLYITLMFAETTLLDDLRRTFVATVYSLPSRVLRLVGNYPAVAPTIQTCGEIRRNYFYFVDFYFFLMLVSWEALIMFEATAGVSILGIVGLFVFAAFLGSGKWSTAPLQALLDLVTYASVYAAIAYSLARVVPWEALPFLSNAVQATVLIILAAARCEYKQPGGCAYLLIWLGMMAMFTYEKYGGLLGGGATGSVVWESREIKRRLPLGTAPQVTLHDYISAEEEAMGLFRSVGQALAHLFMKGLSEEGLQVMHFNTVVLGGMMLLTNAIACLNVEDLQLPFFTASSAADTTATAAAATAASASASKGKSGSSSNATSGAAAKANGSAVRPAAPISPPVSRISSKGDDVDAMAAAADSTATEAAAAAVEVSAPTPDETEKEEAGGRGRSRSEASVTQAPPAVEAPVDDVVAAAVVVEEPQKKEGEEAVVGLEKVEKSEGVKHDDDVAAVVDARERVDDGAVQVTDVVEVAEVEKPKEEIVPAASPVVSGTVVDIVPVKPEEPKKEETRAAKTPAAEMKSPATEVQTSAPEKVAASKTKTPEVQAKKPEEKKSEEKKAEVEKVAPRKEETVVATAAAASGKAPKTETAVPLKDSFAQSPASPPPPPAATAVTPTKPDTIVSPKPAQEVQKPAEPTTTKPEMETQPAVESLKPAPQPEKAVEAAKPEPEKTTSPVEADSTVDNSSITSANSDDSDSSTAPSSSVNTKSTFAATTTTATSVVSPTSNGVHEKLKSRREKKRERKKRQKERRRNSAAAADVTVAPSQPAAAEPPSQPASAASQALASPAATGSPIPVPRSQAEAGKKPSVTATKTATAETATGTATAAAVEAQKAPPGKAQQAPAKAVQTPASAAAAPAKQTATTSAAVTATEAKGKDSGNNNNTKNSAGSNNNINSNNNAANARKKDNAPQPPAATENKKQEKAEPATNNKGKASPSTATTPSTTSKTSPTTAADSSKSTSTTAQSTVAATTSAIPFPLPKPRHEQKAAAAAAVASSSTTTISTASAAAAAAAAPVNTKATAGKATGLVPSTASTAGASAAEAHLTAAEKLRRSAGQTGKDARSETSSSSTPASKSPAATKAVAPAPVPLKTAVTKTPTPPPPATAAVKAPATAAVPPTVTPPTVAAAAVPAPAAAKNATAPAVSAMTTEAVETHVKTTGTPTRPAHTKADIKTPKKSSDVPQADVKTTPVLTKEPTPVNSAAAAPSAKKPASPTAYDDADESYDLDRVLNFLKLKGSYVEDDGDRSSSADSHHDGFRGGAFFNPETPKVSQVTDMRFSTLSPQAPAAPVSNPIALFSTVPQPLESQGSAHDLTSTAAAARLSSGGNHGGGSGSLHDTPQRVSQPTPSASEWTAKAGESIYGDVNSDSFTSGTMHPSGSSFHVFSTHPQGGASLPQSLSQHVIAGTSSPRPQVRSPPTASSGTYSMPQPLPPQTQPPQLMRATDRESVSSSMVSPPMVPQPATPPTVYSTGPPPPPPPQQQQQNLPSPMNRNSMTSPQLPFNVASTPPSFADRSSLSGSSTTYVKVGNAPSPTSNAAAMHQQQQQQQFQHFQQQQQQHQQVQYQQQPQYVQQHQQPQQVQIQGQTYTTVRMGSTVQGMQREQIILSPPAQGGQMQTMPSIQAAGTTSSAPMMVMMSTPDGKMTLIPVMYNQQVYVVDTGNVMQQQQQRMQSPHQQQIVYTTTAPQGQQQQQQQQQQGGPMRSQPQVVTYQIQQDRSFGPQSPSQGPPPGMQQYHYQPGQPH